MFQNYASPGYNPLINYQLPQANVQQTSNLIRVTGIDGAKAYQMQPNSVVPLFDDQNDILYVKSTDGAGFPTIRTFAFSAIESVNNVQAYYISRTEFEEFKASVLKQPQKALKGDLTNGE